MRSAVDLEESITKEHTEKITDVGSDDELDPNDFSALS